MFIDIKEQIAVLETYIHLATGKEVRVNTQQFNTNPFSIMLLSQAYQIAIAKLQKDNIQLQLIR